LRSIAELVSIPEGIERLRNGRLRNPLFSIWFDDGMAGVRRYALPVLARCNSPAAVSVCSRFFYRKEFFWRFQLSYLDYIDGLRFLRSRLRKHGLVTGMSVKDFTLDSFSESVLQAIHQVYDDFTSAELREDAFRLFETPEGLQELAAENWNPANHTAAHYPVGESQGLPFLEDQFNECEDAIVEVLGEPSEFWVLPFDRPRRRSEALMQAFETCAGGRWLVLVGNRLNTPATLATGRLFRIAAPICRGKRFTRALKACSRRDAGTDRGSLCYENQGGPSCE